MVHISTRLGYYVIRVHEPQKSDLMSMGSFVKFATRALHNSNFVRNQKVKHYAAMTLTFKCCFNKIQPTIFCSIWRTIVNLSNKPTPPIDQVPTNTLVVRVVAALKGIHLKNILAPRSVLEKIQFNSWCSCHECF